MLDANLNTNIENLQMTTYFSPMSHLYEAGTLYVAILYKNICVQAVLFPSAQVGKYCASYVSFSKEHFTVFPYWIVIVLPLT